MTISKCMRRIFLVFIALVFCCAFYPLKASAAAAPASTSDVSAYTGAFREMTAKELTMDMGPGYSNDGLCFFDFNASYDPYLSIPVYLNVGCGVRDDSTYNMNWKAMLLLNQKVSISLSFQELKSLPKGLKYDFVDLCAGVKSWQDVPISLNVENARIEFKNQTFDLSKLNGTFSVNANSDERYDKNSAWLFAGVANGTYPDLPTTNKLKKGTFKADVTLLKADGPSKADYYSYSGLMEYRVAPTAKWFSFLKSQGFRSIRFQITWFNHTRDDTYQIDQGWLEKVRNTVDLALENGLYCIINMNWDMCASFSPLFTGGMSQTEIDAIPFTQGWLTLDGNPKVEERFAAVWKQIATYFKDYDEHLLFESMNEPNAPSKTVTDAGGKGNRNGLVKLGKLGERVNKLNQVFVDTVRSTGGNNSQRFILVPPYAQRAAFLKDFTLPTDSASHVLVGLNYYLGDHDGADKGNPFPSIQKYLTAKDISAVFTEFGSNYNEYGYEDRLEFTKQATQQAKEAGIPILWYSGGWGEESADNPEFSLYNPYTYECVFPDLLALLMNSAR